MAFALVKSGRCWRRAIRTPTKGKRDAAALALAYVCFSRRSEIPPLNLDDLTINDEGAAVLIARQKNRADP